MTSRVSRFIVLVCYFLVLFLISPLNSEGQESSNSKNKKLLLAFGFDTNIILYADIKDARVAIDRWMSRAAEENNINQATFVFDNFESLLNAMKTGQLNAAAISSLNYLYLSRACEVEPLYGAMRKGKKTEKHILIGHSNSETSEIKMLKGKKLIMREGNDIGLLYLRTLLLRNKLGQIENFFPEITYKRTASQAVLSLYFGQADVCLSTDGVFNTMAELNPQVGKKLSVIAASEEIVSVVGCIRKDADPKLKQIVQEWLINFKNTTTGKQLLELFKMESMFTIEESDLSSIKGLLNEHENLKKNMKTRIETVNGSKKITFKPK